MRGQACGAQDLAVPAPRREDRIPWRCPSTLMVTSRPGNCGRTAITCRGNHFATGWILPKGITRRLQGTAGGCSDQRIQNRRRRGSRRVEKVLTTGYSRDVLLPASAPAQTFARHNFMPILVPIHAVSVSLHHNFSTVPKKEEKEARAWITVLICPDSYSGELLQAE